MTKILIIDNYDSFTYNLVHYLEGDRRIITVLRNDEVSLDEIAGYDKIVLSPGPGVPDDAGMLKAIIKEYAPLKSMLGICLGQQAIAEVFGGSLFNLEKVYHGVATSVTILVDNEPLFAGIESPFMAGRYHSWSVDPATFPDVLEVTSTDENGIIMSLRHKIYNVSAVQFHPESILTPQGKKIIDNWLLS